MNKNNLTQPGNNDQEIRKTVDDVVEVMIPENESNLSHGVTRQEEHQFSKTEGDSVLDLIRPKDEIKLIAKKISTSQEVKDWEGKNKKINLSVTLATGEGDHRPLVDLFMDCESLLLEVLILPEPDLKALTAHIMSSYFQDLYPSISYHAFIGTAGSGKSTALKAIHKLAYNNLWLSGADTDAAVIRSIDKIRGTVCFEEIQKDGQDSTGIFHKIVTMGNEQPGIINKSRETKDEGWDTQSLNVFGVKFFGGQQFFNHEAMTSRTFTTRMRSGLRTNLKYSPSSPDWLKRAEQFRNNMLLQRQMRLLGETKPASLHLRDLEKYWAIGNRPFQVFSWLFNEAPTQEILEALLSAIQIKLNGDKEFRKHDRDIEILISILFAVRNENRLYKDIAMNSPLYATDSITALCRAIGTIHQKFRFKSKATNQGKSTLVSVAELEELLDSLGVDPSDASLTPPPPHEEVAT